MRNPRSFLPFLVLAAALAAQSPLSMPFLSDNGLGTNSQILFDLNVVAPGGVTIAGVDVNTGATPVFVTGTIEVYTGPTTYVGNETNAAAWTLARSGNVEPQGNDVA